MVCVVDWQLPASSRARTESPSLCPQSSGGPPSTGRTSAGVVFSPLITNGCIMEVCVCVCVFAAVCGFLLNKVMQLLFVLLLQGRWSSRGKEQNQTTLWWARVWGRPFPPTSKWRRGTKTAGTFEDPLEVWSHTRKGRCDLVSLTVSGLPVGKAFCTDKLSIRWQAWRSGRAETLQRLEALRTLVSKETHGGGVWAENKQNKTLPEIYVYLT